MHILTKDKFANQGHELCDETYASLRDLRYKATFTYRLSLKVKYFTLAAFNLYFNHFFEVCVYKGEN